MNERIFWILLYQLTFASVMAVSAYALMQLQMGFRVDHLYPILWVSAGWNLLSWVLLKLPPFSRVESKEAYALAWAQVLFGTAFAATIVHHSGGAESNFTLLFSLQICLAAILVQTRGALVAGVLSASTYVAVVLYKHDGLLETIIARLSFNASLMVLVGAGLAYVFRNRERIQRELHATRKELSKTFELQQTLLDHIPSGVLYLSREAEVKWQNRAATKILGRSYEGIFLKDSSLARLSLTEERRETEIELDGTRERRVLGHHATLLPDGGTVLVFQDVTEIRALEEKIRLQGKLVAIGEFAAALAHEIKNPLASMSGSIQLLKSEMAVAKAVESKHVDRLMSIVIRETDRLDHLLQNFLNYAKPSQVQKSQVILKPLIEEIIELLKVRVVDQSPLTWTLSISDSFSISADALMLRQIFWNLLKNAQESRASEVEVLANEKDQTVIVRDDGSGIPKMVISKVFDPFFTTKETGTGLGLALVYQMIRAHGAEIRVESEEGRGTKFELHFPSEGNWEKAA